MSASLTDTLDPVPELDVEQVLSDFRTPSSADRIRSVKDRLFGRPRRLVPPRYELREEIGRGSFGQVYRALDLLLGRRSVAIKVVPFHSALDEARIEREAEALSLVEHPNVVGVFDRGRADRGVYFLALEYVEGTRLDAWLRERERSLEEILGVFLQIAEGLAAVHRRGLVHRDFKPANVVVDAEGRPRLLDFGLARRVVGNPADEVTGDDVRGSAATHPGATDGPHAVLGAEAMATTAAGAPSESCAAVSWSSVSLQGIDHGAHCSRAEPRLDASLSERGRFVGSALFASPEQLKGRDADSRSDQFSFCVTLFHAVYGHRPFLGRTLGELAETVTSGEITERKPRRAVPRWLAKLLRRGLAPLPEDRHESLDEIIEILRSHTRPRTSRWQIGAAAALAAGLVAALVSMQPDPVLPVTWDDGWRDHRAALQERHGAAVVDALDRFETRWTTVQQSIAPRSATGAQIECLERGKERFGTMVEALQRAPSAREVVSARVSMTPTRLWVAELYAPEACREPVPAVTHRASDDIADRLMQSQLEQLRGDYTLALALADEARELAPRSVERLSGMIDFQRGALQLQLDRASAWDTLGRAALAHGGDVELLGDILTTRLMAGVLHGVSEPDLARVIDALDAVQDQLGDRVSPERAASLAAWKRYGQGLHAMARGEHAQAQTHHREAARHFRDAGQDGLSELRAQVADLHAAFALSATEGRGVEAATQASQALAQLETLLGADHPYLQRWRLDVAQLYGTAFVESEDATWYQRLRALLQAVAALSPGDARGTDTLGFEVLRARAELLFIDMMAAYREQTFDARRDEWIARADPIEAALEPYLTLPRHEDLARIANVLSFAHLGDATDPAIPRVVELWLRFERDPMLRNEALSYALQHAQSVTAQKDLEKPK